MEFCENNEFEDPFKERHILLLPEVVLKKVFSYISYNEVASLRIVCVHFNEIGKQVLNNGFRLVEKFLAKCVKEVKSQLPRRESERRKHHLISYSDILAAIDSRMSLLNITFFKYIDFDMCCFIPGKVIDEVFKILHYIQALKPKQLPLHVHEIVTELRDISGMAMEYFEEKIVPSFKIASSLSDNPQKAFTPISKSYYEACKKVNDQNKVISELSAKVTNQGNKISEVNRRLLEYEQRFVDIFSEFSKLKDETLNDDRNGNHELVGSVSPALLSIGSHMSSASSSKDFICPKTYSPCNPNILSNHILEYSPSDVLSSGTDKLMNKNIITEDSKIIPTVKRKLLSDLPEKEEPIRKRKNSK